MAEQAAGGGSIWGNASDWSETGAIQKANQIDDWLAIDPEGTVTVFSGRVELGTGVRTALAQIVAEELDVPIERIKMVMGDTTRTPNEGYTAGSKTIQYGGFALRQASAQARGALLEMASERLDAALDELETRDGVISDRHHPFRTVSYAELIGGKRFDRTLTGQAPVKPSTQYRVIGKPVPRIELPLKFSGTPSFVHDVRMPGMLHGRVVRPPSPGAQLTALHENSIDGAQVVRLGNFVGVVAEREEAAVRAADRIRVEWKETTRFPAMQELYDFLLQAPATKEVVAKRGRVSAALKAAETRLSATYRQPYHAHASIGPSCAVADVRDDRATVWCATQGVYPLRGALADLLNLPADRVEVIHAEGAGAYGHNGADDVAADAAVLSRAVGRPVRVQWSRQNEFAWEPYGPAMVMQAHGGLDARGRMIALDYAVWSPTHTNRPRVAAQFLAAQLIDGRPAPAPKFFLGGDRNAPTNYEIPNSRVTMHWLAASPLRTSSFRTLGGVANTFANESFVDELAAAAKADPLEFRLRHLTDPRAIEVLKAAAQRAHWGAPLDAGEGRGIAFAQYENDQAYVAAVAQVKVDRRTGETRVTRIVVAHDCGLIVNPDGLRNQIEGNVIQSTSRALKEQVTFDESHVTSVDWDSYPILKFSEVPEVQVVPIDHPELPPLGAGEPASVVVAPAIANAIFGATGARIREVPFTPRRVRAALGQSG
ncbi:MAG: molybdopterin-dependent oxidoreductase [Chloroflexi bacterium]|nr:molybdopterin-dependent oxidoreductase [Chloroflexota bacterium]